MVSLDEPYARDGSRSAVEPVNEYDYVIEHAERRDARSAYGRVDHARRQLFVQVSPVGPMNRQCRREHSRLMTTPRVARIKRIANELLGRYRRQISPRQSG